MPRVELIRDGVRYSQCYDTRAVITTSGNAQQISVKVHASLVTLDQAPLSSPVCVKLEYRLTDGGVGISGRVYGQDAAQARFVLPVVADKARVEVPGACSTERIFMLTGGFDATEYTIVPDADGRFAARIELQRDAQ